MITLAILNQMEADGVADLVIDSNCFWEQAPLLKDGKPASGVWLVTRGGSAMNSPKGYNLHSTVDFYVALANKPKTEYVHQQILEWIINNPCFCELTDSVGGITYDFKNVRIRPTTTPQNFVVTENNLVVKIASAEIIYDIN
ncbi:hypothetical protein [Fibrobacter sp.]|uniref:hypothetical protein n=1 Tax=Fibrobacter sp. TaxID=35828 RepID=UPI00388D5276